MCKNDFLPEVISSTAFFSGHRNISENDKNLISEMIFHSLIDAYDSGYRRFWSGCALGFDTLAANQVIRFREIHSDICLLLAIPCKTQADTWKESDRILYHQIIDQADEKVILSPVYYQGAMFTRNRYMADRSSLCICWLKKMRGGTASTVRYALQNDRISINNLALHELDSNNNMREQPWNSMFISPSVNKSAVTVPLHLSRRRNLTIRNIRD